MLLGVGSMLAPDLQNHNKIKNRPFGVGCRKTTTSHNTTMISRHYYVIVIVIVIGLFGEVVKTSPVYPFLHT